MSERPDDVRKARLGRPERSVDPGAGPVERLAWELRRLRERSGTPSYRTLAKTAHYSASTLAEAAKGDRLPSLAVVLAYARACGGDQPEWEARWRVAAQGVARLSAGASADDGSAADALRVPYLGLAAFAAEDADSFFGRSELVGDLLQRVEQDGLVAVFGASGSGKSSVLRAGLLPQLNESWRSVVLSPGALPLWALAAATDRLVAGSSATGSATALHRELQAGPAALGIALGTWMAGQPADRRVLLVVDQFEELFALCTDDGERDAFLAALSETVRTGGDRVRILIAVRADFYDRCIAHPGLADALRSGAHLPVGMPTRTALREIITEPAARMGVAVDSDLVETVLAEAADQPGALPLVAHAMREAWTRRRGDVLRLADYRATGGMRGAITQTAEEMYASLPSAHQHAMRAIFLRLTAPGEGVEDTRRRLTRDELHGLTDTSTLNALLDRLSAARLIVLAEDTVEVAHEAVLRSWPRLRHWLDSDRDALRTHHRLTRAAHTWRELSHDPHTLYRGPQLDAAYAWARTHAGEVNELEASFLDAGLAAARAEQRAGTRTKRRLRRLTASVATLVVLGLIAGVALWGQSRSHSHERLQAEARRVAALAGSLRSSDPVIARQLSAAAWKLADLPETRSALLGAMTQQAKDVFTVPGADSGTTQYLSDDGRTVVSVGAQAVTTWDVHTHNRLASLPGLGNELAHAGVLGHGLRNLTLPRDGQVRLWNLATGSFDGDPLRADGADISPSGRTLLLYSSTDTEHLIQLRDLTTQAILLERALPRPPATPAEAAAGQSVPLSNANLRRVLRKHPLAVYPYPTAVVSTDDRVMALCVPGKPLEIWDLANRRKTEAPWTPGATADNCLEEDFQFTPDGRKLALLSSSGVRSWDIVSGRELPTIEHAGLKEVRFSADGTLMAAVDADEIMVWRSAAPRVPVYRYALPNESASELRLDAQAGTLRYMGGTAGIEVRTLSLGGLLDSRWQDQSALAAGFSPDGTNLITAHQAANGQSIRFGLREGPSGSGVTDLPDVPCPPPLAGQSPRTPCGRLLLAFSPDGRYVAYGVVDGRVLTPSDRFTVWDIPARRVMQPLEVPRTSSISPDGGGVPAFPANAIAFSPDGASLLVSRDPAPEVVEVWSVRDRTRTKVVAGLGGEVLATRPDGHVLATSHGQLLDIASGRVTHRALALSETTAMAFGADGKYLAMGDESGRVTVWDGDGLRRLGVLSPSGAGVSGGLARDVTALAFSRDGRTLAVADKGGMLRLWDVASSQQLGSAFPAPGGTDLAVAFGTDGSTLQVAGEHVSLRSYRIEPEHVADDVCQWLKDESVPVLSKADWATYVPGASYSAPC